MEVINENVAMLSNFEVYDLLSKSQKKAKGKKPNGGSQNLATIIYETTEYLVKTPCAHQDPAVIEEFLKSLRPYNLTKAEKLQLLNLRPTSPVEIQLMIEEIEERLTEDKVTNLLELIASILPDPASSQDAMETDDGATEASGKTHTHSEERTAEQ